MDDFDFWNHERLLRAHGHGDTWKPHKPLVYTMPDAFPKAFFKGHIHVVKEEYPTDIAILVEAKRRVNRGGETYLPASTAFFLKPPMASEGVRVKSSQITAV